MSEHAYSHAYSKLAIKELRRLDTKARKDICTIVPILSRHMVEEACGKKLKISEGGRILREAGISEIALNLYRLRTDDTHSIICRFKDNICAILSIHQQEKQYERK